MLVGGREASREELLALIADQAALIAEQTRLIDEVVAGNEALSASNETLQTRIEALAAQVAELKRRLGLNSKNSSKPPSSDGLAKPPTRSLRRKSGRRPGKQPGAAGATLAQVPDPDEVVEHRPDACRGCRGGLDGAEVVGVARRQVVEVPQIRRRVVEHRVLSCRCACGTVSTATAPPGVNAPVQYGPGLAALAVYLLVAHHIPFKRVARVLEDLLGHAVSAGWINSCLTRTATALTGFRDRLQECLRRAELVHFDESGVRVDARLWWVHFAGTDLLTSYHLDHRRGHTAMDAHAILPALCAPQVALHDGWKAYLMARYAKVDHALCNAHHLRELDGWQETDPTRHRWAKKLADLLRHGHRLVKKAVAAGRDRLARPTLTTLHHRWQHAVAEAYAANPPPATGKGRGDILALIDRMRGYTTEIWRFAHDFTVAFDNNQAERDIRMTKLQNKISGGWRTAAGGRDWLRVREYLSTAAKHGIDLLTALRDALTGNPWLPPLPE